MTGIPPQPKSGPGRLIELGAIASLYIVTGKLGFMMAVHPGNVTTVWPPSGIALAAVLFRGPGVWPAVWTGSFIVNVVFFLERAPLSVGAVAVSAAIAAGSTLQALLGSWLIHRLIGPANPLNRARDVFKFAAIALASCTLAATLGVAGLALGGFAPWNNYRYLWSTWWVGDVIGVLLVTPLILAWSMAPRWDWVPGRLAEAAALLASLLAAGWVVFGVGPSGPEAYPFPFALMPFLIWAAFRFGQRGLMVTSLVMSVLAIIGTDRGAGPFASPMLNESLLFLQAFVGIVTITGLVLAAALSERDQAQDALRLAHGELERRIEERTAKLTQTLQQLQATQLQLIQAEKLESVGRLAAGVAHEVKNPLATLLMGVEYLAKREIGRTDHVEIVLNDMATAVGRADAIIAGLLNFSAPGKLDAAPVDLHALIEQALLLVKHELTKHHIQVVTRLSPQMPRLRLDAQKVIQVFVNLLLNAIDAMGPGGTLTVSTRAEADAVVAEVDDTGTGVAEPYLNKIFDPFFTTKPTGKGTGLGLAVSKTIIELHGGTIVIGNRPEGGARATLRFSVRPLP